ncbi:MAG: hypothetical protein IPG07_12110 [Crocinitomicaceae bacterium]|nr:hypothetical protein [Crocinitomicaceae bacterium]
MLSPLVSDEELVKYKVPTLLTRYESLDLNVLHSPIVDYGLPDIAQMKSILNWVQKKKKAKRKYSDPLCRRIRPQRNSDGHLCQSLSWKNRTRGH